MSVPLVSVLIPAVDAARWIADTLESVDAQTWPSIEVIVAESGSTDGTREIVRSRQSRNVTLLPDIGLASAAENRNRAMDAAQGKFFQFLDADDLIGPDKIRRQVERLENDGDCVASAEWARFHETPDDARVVRESVWRDVDTRTWLVEAWTGGEPMMQPGIWLVPRGVADRAGPWDESLTLIDDFEYFTRVLLAARDVRFCSGSRLYYRSGNPHSLASRRSPAAWRSAWRALDSGTGRLLAHVNSPEARSACADLFQQLAFEAALEDEDVAHRAEIRVAELGGSSIRMGGGALFRLVRDVAGWRNAKRVKRACYRLGYDRVARAKELALQERTRR